jgi:hypothetical protein
VVAVTAKCLSFPPQKVKSGPRHPILCLYMFTPFLGHYFIMAYSPLRFLTRCLPRSHLHDAQSARPDPRRPRQPPPGTRVGARAAPAQDPPLSRPAPCSGHEQGTRCVFRSERTPEYSRRSSHVYVAGKLWPCRVFSDKALLT